MAVNVDHGERVQPQMDADFADQFLLKQEQIRVIREILQGFYLYRSCMNSVIAS